MKEEAEGPVFTFDPEDLIEGRFNNTQCYYLVVSGIVGDFSQAAKRQIERTAAGPFFPWWAPFIGKTRQMLLVLLPVEAQEEEGLAKGAQKMTWLYLDNEDGTALAKAKLGSTYKGSVRAITPAEIKRQVRNKKAWRKESGRLCRMVSTQIKEAWLKYNPERYNEHIKNLN